MAKLEDMLNEVATVIKLGVLQKYFLHLDKFKGKKIVLQADGWENVRKGR